MSFFELHSIDDRLAWPGSMNDIQVEILETLVDGRMWDGPLIISMPRTGSTLLASLFLLLKDQQQSSVFNRYIHEPVAPLFWQNKPIDSIVSLTKGKLLPDDIIQESAYQFYAKKIATWFIQKARKPVVFVMRHPQIAWPSRWRILIQGWLESNTGSQETEMLNYALGSNDFAALGKVLTNWADPPDNGWYAFLSLINYCMESNIDFVIIDNKRFRTNPDDILRKLCERWAYTYDDSMIKWKKMSRIKSRVVMSELASVLEYDRYYAKTFESEDGIIAEDRPLVPLEKFPENLRSHSNDHLTIDKAVDYYERLLTFKEVL